MRYLKLLGLAAIAALGLMAFLGAGTASATTLCKATETPDCGVNNHYGPGTKLHATLKAGTSAKLTDTSGNTVATCTGSTVLGEQENTTETYIKVSLSKITWEGCNQTTDTVKAGTLDIDWIEGTHNGTVIATEAEVTLNIFGVSCTYGARGAGEGVDLGTLTGGAPGQMDIKAIVKKLAGGFLCPETAVWEAEYTVTEPNPVYVTT